VLTRRLASSAKSDSSAWSPDLPDADTGRSQFGEILGCNCAFSKSPRNFSPAANCSTERNLPPAFDVLA
jgi:hypothetical protein